MSITRIYDYDTNKVWEIEESKGKRTEKEPKEIPDDAPEVVKLKQKEKNVSHKIS
jgi:hypothetical protein